MATKLVTCLVIYGGLWVKSLTLTIVSVGGLVWVAILLGGPVKPDERPVLR